MKTIQCEFKEFTRTIKGHTFKISLSTLGDSVHGYKDVWFLDELEKSSISPSGIVINNICNGSYEYCFKELDKLKESI